MYGPSGSGKKTRVLATLRELYGPGVEKLKIDIKTFVTPSSRKLEFNVISSPYHLEITPSDMMQNDRIVIQDLLKEIAQTESVDFTNVMDNLKPTTKKNKFKVVIINEAELLTRDAQAALRRTMEKYSSNIRLILICNSTSNIISPIKSRTLLVRVLAPKPDEIVQCFSKIIKREELSKVLPRDDEERNAVLTKILELSERNLRKSILMFETMYMNNDVISLNTPIIKLDWEEVLEKLSETLMLKRNVATIQQLRSTLYELISHCIPSKIILQKIVANVWLNCDSPKFQIRDVDQVKLGVIEAGAIFDERLSLGSKEIFHLEGFIIRVMYILEKDSVS